MDAHATRHGEDDIGVIEKRERETETAAWLTTAESFRVEKGRRHAETNGITETPPCVGERRG